MVISVSKRNMRKYSIILPISSVVIIILAGAVFFGGYGKRANNESILTLKSLGIEPGTVHGICSDCNVILLSVDSLRADHVSTLGYRRDTTPNFDKFSQSGALFLNNFSTSFLTPVSEMSVQTGLYPSSNGVTNFDTVLPDNKVTITRYLKSKGYKTSAVFSSPEFKAFPAIEASFSRSFDRYEYVNPLIAEDESRFRQFPVQSKLDSELDALGDKKFFLWLAVGGVHWPYGWTANNVYADDKYDGVFKGVQLDYKNVFMHLYKNVLYPSGKKLNEADMQYVRDQYDNGVREFDDFLGGLLSELKQRNLLKKTLIVIESEHGEGLGEHGYVAHYDVFDTQTHTPLYIFIPSLQSGQRVSSMSSSIDIFPTIIELLGDTVPDWIQGKSLVPIISGREHDNLRKEVFLERIPLWEEAEHSSRNALEVRGISVVSGVYKDIAIRTPEWKYILRTAREREEAISLWKTLTGIPVHIPEAELYDMVHDPLETKNVINKYPEEAEILRKKLEDWSAKISPNSPLNIERKRYIQPYF